MFHIRNTRHFPPAPKVTVHRFANDYYARLEHGRERNPSGQVMDAIGRALQLDADALWHAYRPASLVPHTPPRPRLDLLATSPLAAALLSPLGAPDNMVRALPLLTPYHLA